MTKYKRGLRSLNMQLTPELHEKLKAVSKADMRTMKAWTAIAVTASVEKAYAKLQQAEVAQ